MIRITDFGAVFSTAAGYCTPRWFVAGQFGFDKAIVTQLKNGDAMKAIYPAVQDG